MKQDSPTELTKQSGVNSKMWLEFIVPGVPLAEQRARRGKNKSVHTTEPSRDFRKRVAEAAAEAMYGQPAMTGPLHVHLGFHLPMPKSWPADKRAAAVEGLYWPDVKPDHDNLAKAVNDGCTGIVWCDDCQIVHGVQFKRYSEEPMTIVLVKRMGEGS